MTAFRRALTAAVVVLVPSMAFAQERGDTGISMGYPSAISLVWHATDTIAIRPEITVTRNSSSAESSGIERESSSWATGVGASALFYVTHDGNLRTYLSPRVAYSRTTSKTDAILPLEDTIENTTNSTTVTGSFGAQYSVGERFSVFGEVGLAIVHSWSEGFGSLTNTSANTFGTRSGAGIIFYF
jgi:hypothetical protein